MRLTGPLWVHQASSTKGRPKNSGLLCKMQKVCALGTRATA